MFDVDIGPQVAIIDDKRDEVESLEDALKELNIAYHFVDADMSQGTHPLKPIESIKLVFLDLYYNSLQFDPDICAQWIDELIVEDCSYNLVIWSKDSGEKTEALLKVLNKLNKTPKVVVIKQKTDYQLPGGGHNADKLIHDIKHDIDQNETVTEFIGEIIDVQKDQLLVNCLLNEDKKVFQIRRFDIKPLLDLVEEKYIKIKITTKSGSRTFEFLKLHEPKEELFKKKDVSKDIENTRFFKGG